MSTVWAFEDTDGTGGLRSSNGLHFRSENAATFPITFRDGATDVANINDQGMGIGSTAVPVSQIPFYIVKSSSSNLSTYNQNTGTGGAQSVQLNASGSSIANRIKANNDSEYENNAGDEIFLVPSTHNFLFKVNNTETFRVTSAGVQVTGTLTGATNLPGSYTTGTWVPTVSGETTAGTTTYVGQQGTYTKIGRMVFATFFVNWSSATGTGNLRISGLPVADGTQPNGYLGYCQSNVTMPVGTTWLNVAMDALGVTYCNISASGSAVGTSYISLTSNQGNSYIKGVAIYEASS